LTDIKGNHLKVIDIVKNTEAQKLINRIQKDLINSGIEPIKIVKTLKKLRDYALEEKNPTLTKVLRLTYEHISGTKTFQIPIPDDEPVDEIDGDTVEHKHVEDPDKSKPVESLNYLLSIMSNSDNKGNIIELKEYRNALLEYAETH